MAEKEKVRFQKGDFLKKNHKKGSFMIYEGDDISTTNFKKITLLLFYDPEAYERNSMGVYEQTPRLYVGDKYKPSSETIDTMVEDYWISICNEEEIQAAHQKLQEYGYKWDAEKMELTKIENGELVRKIIVPDNTYYGHIIKPSPNQFKDLAQKYCQEENKVTTSYQYCY